MRRKRLKQRLGGRRRLIEPRQRLAPPGQPDSRHHRLGASGEDAPESDVKTPQGLKSGACGGGYISESESTVGVEIAGQR